MMKNSDQRQIKMKAVSLDQLLMRCCVISAAEWACVIVVTQKQTRGTSAADSGTLGPSRFHSLAEWLTLVPTHPIVLTLSLQEEWIQSLYVSARPNINILFRSAQSQVVALIINSLYIRGLVPLFPWLHREMKAGLRMLILECSH